MTSEQDGGGYTNSIAAYAHISASVPREGRGEREVFLEDLSYRLFFLESDSLSTLAWPCPHDKGKEGPSAFSRHRIDPPRGKTFRTSQTSFSTKKSKQFYPFFRIKLFGETILGKAFNMMRKSVESHMPCALDVCSARKAPFLSIGEWKRRREGQKPHRHQSLSSSASFSALRPFRRCRRRRRRSPLVARRRGL